MNKKELIKKVSEKSGVDLEHCTKVINAFEEVFRNEISESKGKRFTFNLIYKIMSFIKNKSAILFLCLLVSIGVFAQHDNPLTQTIRGTVVDQSSNFPIPLITIEISNLSKIETITDDKGQFVLKNVPLGRHTIKTRSVEYEPSIIQEVLITSAKEVYLEVVLKKRNMS